MYTTAALSLDDEACLDRLRALVRSSIEPALFRSVMVRQDHHINVTISFDTRAGRQRQFFLQVEASPIPGPPRPRRHLKVVR